MINTMIAESQEDFSLYITNKAAQKTYSHLSCHGPTIEDKTHFFLGVARRSHIDVFLLRIEIDDLCLHFKGAFFSVVDLILDTSLITFVYCCSFLFRPRNDIWISFLKPLLELFSALLMRWLNRFWSGKAPSFEVVGNSPQRRFKAESFLDGQRYRSTSTKSKGKLEFLGRLMDAHDPYSFFLLTPQNLFRPKTSSSLSKLNGLNFTNQILFNKLYCHGVHLYQIKPLILCTLFVFSSIYRFLAQNGTTAKQFGI